MTVHHIVLSQHALEALMNGMQVNSLLPQKDIEIRIRRYEDFTDNEARADWIKEGKYIYTYKFHPEPSFFDKLFRRK